MRVGACNKHNAMTDIMRPSAKGARRAVRNRLRQCKTSGLMGTFLQCIFVCLAIVYNVDGRSLRCVYGCSMFVLWKKNVPERVVAHSYVAERALSNACSFLCSFFACPCTQLLVLLQHHKVGSEQLSQFPRVICQPVDRRLCVHSVMMAPLLAPVSEY